jgi:Domain of unknown function (DUF4262)
MPTEFEKKVGDYMTGTVIPGVVEHGWMVQGVMADPPFLYTVGLAMNVGYEILIAGLPLEHAADIVNDVAHHVMGAVNPPVDGALLHGIIEDLPLRWRHRDSSVCAVGVARLLVLGDDFDVWQLEWPDDDGHFPGDPAMNPAMAALQAPTVFTQT